MNHVHSHNRIYAPIVLGVTLLVGLFLLKPVYTDYMDTRTTESTLTRTLGEKQAKYDALKKMQESFQSGSGASELVNRVNKIDKKWNEADIFSSVMINDFTKGNSLTPPLITVSSISLTKWQKLPNWLSLGTVNLGLSAGSIDQIIEYLTYLTQNTDFVFTLDNISLPLDTGGTDQESSLFSLSVSLGVYYFE